MQDHIMETNAGKIFYADLHSTIVRYPNLKIKDDGTEKYLKGILDVPDDFGDIIKSFLVEIKCNQEFPYRFPKLFEVGGDIPIEPAWHRNPNGSCCITVEADEILKCKQGISIERFIVLYGIPFLANHIFRVEKGYYKNGEYGHGDEGTEMYYKALLKTSDKETWLKYFNHTFVRNNINIGRNDLCFCDSNLKYKRCHENMFVMLFNIGKNQVSKDFKKLQII
jgi:hypothetical protein